MNERRRSARTFRFRFSSSLLLRSESGLSLLELLVALLVLEIAITGFAQFFLGGLDLSRKARDNEVAQILAQNKMEELLRTAPAEIDLVGKPGARFLQERPAAFHESVPGVPEAGSFRWLAELTPAPQNPKLAHLSLHVYAVRSRPVKGEAAAEEDFFVSDDRKRFNLIQTADDGSRQIIQGKEQIQLITAVAVP
jgi:type II secretory pathway pseudopilin PulG